MTKQKSWLENKCSITCDSAILGRGFVQIPVLILGEADLHPGAKIVYAGLLWYLWRSQDYPGHEAAGQDWGMSRGTVRKYLEELEERGLIQHNRPGLGQPNSYHLLDPEEVIIGLQKAKI